MSIFDKLFKIYQKEEKHHAHYVDFSWQSNTGLGVRTFPDLIRLSHYYYDTNILLRTIISVLERETFKNSIAVMKDGVKIPKDESKFKSLLAKANDTQTLEQVLRMAYIELNVCANAIIICELQYIIGDDGLLYRQLKQIYKANLEYSELIMSADGKAGMTDQGMIMFCPNHRNYARQIKLTGDGETDLALIQDLKCIYCDFPLLPAYLRFNHPYQGVLYYSSDEVIHLAKWRRGLGMGIPPITTFLQYMYIMEAHNYFISTAYSLQRPPNSLIVLRGGNYKNLEGALQKAFIEAQQSPHLLPIISVDADVPEKLIEVVNLSSEIKEQDYQKMRDEITSKIAALYGVSPIFTGDLRGVGGLNQEGLQIMVTNRVIEDEQRILNEALKKISLLIDPTGREVLVMEKNELRDENMIQEYNAKVLQNVQALQGLGYEVEIKMDDEGKLSYKIVGKMPLSEQLGVKGGRGLGLEMGGLGTLSQPPTGAGFGNEGIAAGAEGGPVIEEIEQAEGQPNA